MIAVRIPLGASGRFAFVDACDAERVSQHSWHLRSKRSRPGNVYAARDLPRNGGRKKKQALHTFVVGCQPGQIVDHVNGNGLDNRRENLRECTPRENATNIVSSKNQKRGGYKGVTWNPRAKKWQASICAGAVKTNGKRRQLYLGVFSCPIEAARVYDAAALKYFGEFAAPNFAKVEKVRAA